MSIEVNSKIIMNVKRIKRFIVLFDIKCREMIETGTYEVMFQDQTVKVKIEEPRINQMRKLYLKAENEETLKFLHFESYLSNSKDFIIKRGDRLTNVAFDRARLGSFSFYGDIDMEQFQQIKIANNFNLTELSIQCQIQLDDRIIQMPMDYCTKEYKNYKHKIYESFKISEEISQEDMEAIAFYFEKNRFLNLEWINSSRLIYRSIPKISQKETVKGS